MPLNSPRGSSTWPCASEHLETANTRVAMAKIMADFGGLHVLSAEWISLVKRNIPHFCDFQQRLHGSKE